MLKVRLGGDLISVEFLHGYGGVCECRVSRASGRSGPTEIEQVPEFRVVGVGVARCAKGDAPNVEVGRRLSLGRALRSVSDLSRTKRREVWRAYDAARGGIGGRELVAFRHPWRGRHGDVILGLVHNRVPGPSGCEVKPEAAAIDHRTFRFRFGWRIELEHDRYPGEIAWVVEDGQDLPDGAPIWIASGDLVLLDGPPGC